MSDPICQRRPFDQLQHQRPSAFAFFKAMDLRDVRVVEGSENLRLPLKPRQAIRISRKRLRQYLQRHLAIQLGIGGLIDLFHAPSPMRAVTS